MWRRAFRVAGYRLQRTFARRLGGHLTIVLIIGLVGGLGMAALASARRTQSSFATYLASTNPSNLSFLSGFYHSKVANNNAYNSGYDPGLINTIAHLRHVRRVESYVGLNITALAKNGAPQSLGTALAEGSVDGEFFNQDRVTVVRGRMANPQRANEVVVSAEFARGALKNIKLPLKGIVLGAYTNAQVVSLSYGTAKVKPHFRIVVEVVGVVKFNDTVLQDDVDASPFGRILFTPALTQQLDRCCSGDTASYVQFDHGYHDATKVEEEIVQHLPSGAAPLFQVTSTIATKTEQAIEPESIALGVFGGIALLVAMLLVALVISRQLNFGAVERRSLRALGANPIMVMVDSSVGSASAVIVGSLFAMAVAWLLSPLSPLGPVRPYYPSRGFSFDSTVLGLGMVLLIVGLGSTSGLMAYRGARAHAIRRWQPTMIRRSRVAHSATASALPAAAAAGIRFALEPGTGSSAVPVRSAIMGVTIALTVIVSTLTFGASLDSLVSHPALYGWNWNYELSSPYFGYYDIPQKAVDQLLAHDRYVAAWTGVYFGELQIDGFTEPVIGTSSSPAVGPPILSGREFTRANEVVLGAATLAQLHKRIGDTVEVGNGVTSPIRLRIVGIATLPTVGQAGSIHTTMGTGALLSSGIIPASVRNPFNAAVAGPQAIWVRLRPGAKPTAALRSLQRIVATPSQIGRAHV